ncbi:hypothetical protein [Paractinoplanes deccanensis]|nr:hypothetical protein [Actinoplanes deccanensis]
MTVLWIALIVIGAVMIATAVWPSVRDARPRRRDGHNHDQPT